MTTQTFKKVKINLEQEDPKFFHPSPTKKMRVMIEKIVEGLNWELPKPIEKLTRREAKSIIERGIRSAKRRKLFLLNA